MRFLREFLVVSAVLAGFGAPARAQDDDAVAAGQALYGTHCAECHGARLVNTGSAFDLRTLAPDERARFDMSVMNGKGQMPAWAGQLTKDDLDKLWAYIRSRVD